MSFPVYFLSLAITVLGFGCGAALAFITPYELKQGYKFFVLFQAFLLAIILFILGLRLHSIVGVLLVLLPLLLLRFYPVAFSSKVLFSFLGLLLSLSSRDVQLFLLTSSLIFVYGLPTGTIIVVRFKRTQKEHQPKQYAPLFHSLLVPLGCYVLVALLGYVLFGGTLL
ncbi:hypothetical protein HYW21_08470 [Candidatus Woesearchaeota archaeon]|nr:hypothetical protein [Candidatus Woesearchaeota archaeon]